MPLPSGPVTSRRAALAAGAGGLLTAGCGTGGATPATTSTASPDVDTGIASEAAELSAGLLLLVRTAGRGRPDLRRRLAPLAAMHRAHLDQLPEPGTEPGAGVQGSPEEIALDVVLRETAGARSLRGLAVQAQSGPLARLLASMAAGIAVHVEDLR